MRTDGTAFAFGQAVTKRIAPRDDGTDVTPVSKGNHAEIAARVAGAKRSVFDKPRE